MAFDNDLILLLGVFLTSLFVVVFAIPSIIVLAKEKNLMDEPDDGRKVHFSRIPVLGGVGVFSGFIFATNLFLGNTAILNWNYILASIIILFVVGLKDDLVGVSPKKKFLAQLLTAVIVCVLADVRLTSMYGIFGVFEIPYWISLIISIFTIIVVTNSFNLIDGIDGLAGSIGFICSLIFGILFYSIGKLPHSLIAFSLAGSLLGFLKYNISPAKIFMGDTGSLIVGFLASVFALWFIEFNKPSLNVINTITASKIYSAPGIAIAILIIPLFDTLRVFSIRIIKNGSPFIADRRHIHHRLLDQCNFSHSRATVVLIFVNLFFIGGAYLLRNVGNWTLVLIVLATAFVVNTSFTVYLRFKNRGDDEGPKAHVKKIPKPAL
jgi:UDP-GlcNAc:undecaprenyl-phosphate GlcNAc-1-phosphate transferase